MAAQTIQIEKQAWEHMQKHAEDHFPDECCGFFYGIEDISGRQISIYKPVNNNKEGDKRRRFEVSPIDYIQAERYALENNIQLLGVFHSHPQHPAIPSEHDLSQAMPWFSYIIISIMDGAFNHVRSWKLNESINRFEEENLII